MKHRTNTGKWKIVCSTDFFTGQPNWQTVPPRWVYRPHAEGKRSFGTYDQALAHVQSSSTRRPIVFESKTHHGEFFWHHPEGDSGWEADFATAHAKAHAGREVNV